MKTDIEIVDDVYDHIKASGVMSSEELKNGKLQKDSRITFNEGDAVISLLGISSLNNGIQEQWVNVNVYIRDIDVYGTFERNRKRIKTVSKLFESVLEVGGIGKDYTFHLEKQPVVAVEENERTPEHYINFRLLYQYVID